jgi:hypothetical protein
VEGFPHQMSAYGYNSFFSVALGGHSIFGPQDPSQEAAGQVRGHGQRRVVASYLVEGLPEFSFSDELTAKERGELSSHRKLLAISRTLDFMKRSGSLRPSEWTTLWWLTDNQNVEKMIAKGSGKIKIMYLVLEILKKARSLKYQVEPVWVSRDNTFLQKADAISNGVDTDNWAVSNEDATHLSSLYGRFTIDLFASSFNTKNKRFYSRSDKDGSSGVDALAQDVASECALAAPPVSLIMRTIRKASLTQKLSGVLMIPLWKTA